MLRKLRNHVFAGLLFVLPVFLTIAILKWVFVASTNFTINNLPDSIREHKYLVLLIRLIVPVCILFIFFIIGFLMNSIFIRNIMIKADKMFARIPLFNKIYLTSKEISKGLFNNNNLRFKRVVMFEYPRQGMYTFGFVTSKDNSKIRDIVKSDVSDIFIGTAPNPLTGLLIFMKDKDIKEMDMGVVDGLKLILSGGFLKPVKKGTDD